MTPQFSFVQLLPALARLISNPFLSLALPLSLSFPKQRRSYSALSGSSDSPSSPTSFQNNRPSQRSLPPRVSLRRFKSFFFFLFRNIFYLFTAFQVFELLHYLRKKEAKPPTGCETWRSRSDVDKDQLLQFKQLFFQRQSSPFLKFFS